MNILALDKTLTQQLFHKGKFINRPEKTKSFNRISNPTVETGDSDVIVPEKLKQPTPKQDLKTINRQNSTIGWQHLQ